jgi:Fic family protein
LTFKKFISSIKEKDVSIMFKPRFQITQEITKYLMSIQENKGIINTLPINARILASLRETAKLMTTHYSTAIEGNRMTCEQVEKFIESRLEPKERDELEIVGYYNALEYVQNIAKKNAIITQEIIKTIHAMVMNGNKKKVKPTPYRDGQNVIKDSNSKLIVYMPPEAKDVEILMKELIDWIKIEKHNIPIPILAGIAHYQFATIHPYYDGNGRTARLLTTLILHLNGYDMKGIYSLEEYYAKDLGSYYEALSIGEHNYYMGRAEEDITKWIEYFCKGMAKAFESVRKSIQSKVNDSSFQDKSKLLYEIDERQRRVLELFIKQKVIKSKDIALTLGITTRAVNNLCQKWIENGFIKSTSEAKKDRGYALQDKFEELVL